MAWRELNWNSSIGLDVEELRRSRALICSGNDTHLVWTEPLVRAAGAPGQRVKRSTRQRIRIFLKFFMVLTLSLARCTRSVTSIQQNCEQTYKSEWSSLGGWTNGLDLNLRKTGRVMVRSECRVEGT